MRCQVAGKLAALSLVAVIAARGAAAADEGKEAAAVQAAGAWLALVDDGKYAESWTEAAELFRNAISSEHWVQSAGAARKPLGKLLTRKVKSKTSTTSLPGAPDGEYVVIQYESSFENKKQAVETVTPTRGKDGRWRVSGYFVR
jgi:hypothetical protein